VRDSKLNVHRVQLSGFNRGSAIVSVVKPSSASGWGKTGVRVSRAVKLVKKRGKKRNAAARGRRASFVLMAGQSARNLGFKKICENSRKV